MKLSTLIAPLFLLVACTEYAANTQSVCQDKLVFDYKVRRSHVGWREQLSYPVSFSSHVFLESADESKIPLEYSGHDLATMHLIFAQTWEDLVGSGGDLVAACLEKGVLYVPEDDASFESYCGYEDAAGCMHSAESWGLVGIANYVQVVRWDWYRAMSVPGLVKYYNEIFAHEAAHRVSECLIGHTDRDHEFTFLWKEVVPLVAKRELAVWIESGRATP